MFYFSEVRLSFDMELVQDLTIDLYNDILRGTSAKNLDIGTIHNAFTEEVCFLLVYTYRC